MENGAVKPSIKRYLTLDELQRAKKGAGIYDALPLEKQKLFPFYDFENFALTDGTTRNPKLECGVCSDDLSESGNGLYYCAFIIYDAPNKMYASCPSCMNKLQRCYDYHEQIYGHPEPMILGEYESSIKHKAVWMSFVGRYRAFQLWNYAKGLDYSTAKKLLKQSFGGQTFEGGFISYTESGDIMYEKGYMKDTIWKMKFPEALRHINDVIRFNVTTVAPQPGAQLSLF